MDRKNKKREIMTKTFSIQEQFSGNFWHSIKIKCLTSEKVTAQKYQFQIFLKYPKNS
jgi:hypothetical protein